MGREKSFSPMEFDDAFTKRNEKHQHYISSRPSRPERRADVFITRHKLGPSLQALRPSVPSVNARYAFHKMNIKLHNVTLQFGTSSRAMQGVHHYNHVTCQQSSSKMIKNVSSSYHQLRSAAISASQASNRFSRCTGRRVRLPDDVRRVTDRTRPSRPVWVSSTRAGDH